MRPAPGTTWPNEAVSWGPWTVLPLTRTAGQCHKQPRGQTVPVAECSRFSLYWEGDEAHAIAGLLLIGKFPGVRYSTQPAPGVNQNVLSVRERSLPSSVPPRPTPAAGDGFDVQLRGLVSPSV